MSRESTTTHPQALMQSEPESDWENVFQCGANLSHSRGRLGDKLEREGNTVAQSPGRGLLACAQVSSRSHGAWERDFTFSSQMVPGLFTGMFLWLSTILRVWSSIY